MPGPLTTLNDKTDYSDAMMRVFERQVNDLFQQILSGDIDIGSGQYRFREMVRQMHGMQLIAGAGGDKSLVSSDDWLKLGEELRSQYLYMEKFFRDIASGKISPAQAAARARMYAHSSRATFWRQAVGVDVKLPAVPGDGSTDCVTNCRCRWSFEYERNRRGRVIAVLAKWNILPGENCATCVDRAAQWNPLRIPAARGFDEETLKESEAA